MTTSPAINHWRRSGCDDVEPDRLAGDGWCLLVGAFFVPVLRILWFFPWPGRGDVAPVQRPSLLTFAPTWSRSVSEGSRMFLYFLLTTPRDPAHRGAIGQQTGVLWVGNRGAPGRRNGVLVVPAHRGAHRLWVIPGHRGAPEVEPVPRADADPWSVQQGDRADVDQRAQRPLQRLLVGPALGVTAERPKQLCPTTPVAGGRRRRGW